MIHHRRSNRTFGRLPEFACLVLLVSGAPGASGATWIEQVEAGLTCTPLAEEAERQSLAAPTLPRPVTASALSAYLRGKPRDDRQARFRHLTVLAAIGWWADLVNDQALRGDAYLAIGILADRHAAAAPGDAGFRQVARCARVHLISASIEQDRPRDAERLADNLLRLYPATPPAQAVEDWPLILALRELRLEPRARSGIAQLATRSAEFASAATHAGEPLRASRLLAATGQGLLALGETGKARDLALQSLVVTGRPPAAEAAWRALPTLFDASLALNGAEDAANLQALLQPAQLPAGLRDGQAAFESLLRLSKAAETKEQFEDMARLRAAASARLTDLSGPERPSVPFFRHALDELAAERDPNLALLAKRDPAFGARTLAAYTGTYETLLRQSQNQFVADAREQLHFQFKVDNSLHALTDLHGAMPRSRADIEDVTFRFAQLRSYGRLTLATLAAELDRSSIDPKARPGVERFFSMSTQSSAFLRSLLETIRTAPGSPPPDGETLWKVFVALDVYNEESAKQYARYAGFVRQSVPRVADLATPRPLPVREFQRRLQSGEALVATLVTPRNLYIWAVTQGGVTLARQRVTEREVADSVQRLRAGLVPGSGAGAGQLPPFDAAAAHELYRLVLAPVEGALKGVTTVVWYGHGPLGSVPPAVLVTAPPAKPRLTTPAEFAATKFLVDRFAFTALADLSLFPWHRDEPPSARRGARFLGVGAPMLSVEELSGAPRARSYELAGALDGKALAELPKLAESVDEMKGIAGILGEDNSTLWLGPDAREDRFNGDSLRGYGTIALATHGFLADEVQGVREPSLMLALAPAARDRFDGILTATEIAGLSLDADLVILSACNTAAADGRPRAETFTGLTQAFFTAGTRSMMVSHWPVMSGAAVQLSVGTVRGAHERSLPLAQSLQVAMQATRKEGAQNPIEAHPSYWGPFVIVGDGR
jgi:CHAT domain-containing protein